VIKNDAPTFRSDGQLQTRALAVLGPFRGGTSVTCGVLHKLGVFVGKQFWDANSKYSTFEAVGLRNSCNACFDERFSRWHYCGSHDQRVAQLKQWMDFARREASERSCCGVGGKHPTLCKLVDEAAAAWKCDTGTPPLFIAVIRPFEEVMRGWNKATNSAGKPWWRRPDREHVVADLIQSRDKALQRHEHIQVDFAALRSDPKATITKLATDCGLPLTNLDDAIELLRPSK
jgi:hypothetical protein